ncbi:hypothetical protein QJS10_CPA05g01988 [Acorus calamus]|uniref:Pentatricopeptide repeat-containing protein n=1 Tax=Acorus calamus TaxID=4465 RepID=A0AAV9EY74_ACOCL|nr:hypothetical protein QJS10_CPA05g01988 [Acorus calamus]
MLPRSIPPNHFTHPLLSDDGEKSQARALKSGLGFDRFVRNSLIYMYSNFGRLVSTADVTWISMIDACMKNYLVYEARKAFDRMPRRDRVSWNSMVIAYIAVGELEEAIALFMRMPERDMMCWNPVIDGYAQAGEVSKARELFDRMPKRSAVSYNVMLALYAFMSKRDRSTVHRPPGNPSPPPPPSMKRRASPTPFVWGALQDRL